MLTLFLLVLLTRIVVAPIPNHNDLDIQENLPHQDLQDLTFFNQVVNMEDWDPNRSLRYKRNIKRDYVENDKLSITDNSTFLAQGGKEEKGTKPKWHVGAGIFLNKENYANSEKTLIKYIDDKSEEEYCSGDEWSSDEHGSKLKWFKPFSVPLNETKDISIIPSSRIVSTNKDGTFFSDTGTLQGKFANASKSIDDSLSMGSGGVTIHISCMFFCYILFVTIMNNVFL